MTRVSGAMKVAVYRVDRGQLDRAIFLLLAYRFTPFVVTQTSNSTIWELRVTIDPPVYDGASDAAETLFQAAGISPFQIVQLSGTVHST
jgi:hypothetical protein